MKKSTWFFSAAIFVALAFMLSCSSDSNDNESNNSPAFGNPVSAKPVAASKPEEIPKVLYSWTDGNSNHYVIDAGYIEKIFVSEIGIAHYAGFFPVSFEITTTTSTALTRSMTETVSNSIVISNSQTGKITLDAAVKAKIRKIVDFSVGLKLEGTITDNITTTNSTKTEMTTIESEASSRTDKLSFTIGNNGEAVGHYRYALFATSDIYFVISTSLDNEELRDWDVVSCVREGTYMPYWEYSSNGKFDNSPISNQIEFADDFYTRLPKLSALPPERMEFNIAGNYAYTLDKGFPATIEIYALGGGGGGQGGHSKDRGAPFITNDRPSGVYNGTGGAGGGAAIAEWSGTITEATTFNIKVGAGGSGGSGVYSSYTQDWQSGAKGGNGESTTVTWSSGAVTAAGGNGGGGSGTITSGGAAGGSGGTAGSNGSSSTNMTSEKKSDVTQNDNLRSVGGSSVYGSGGVRETNGTISNAGAGGGSYAGYSQNQNGGKGGDGQVIIVVTYPERN
jgi:hypothetical protein